MGMFSSALSAVFEIYMADLFFSYFGKRKLDKTKHFIICCIFTALLSVSTYYLIPVNKNTLVFSLLIFLFSLSFRIKLPMKILANIALLFIIILGEIVLTFGMFLISDVTVTQIRDVESLRWFMSMFFSKLISFLVLKIVGARKLDTENLSTGFVLGILTMPLSSILIIVALYNTEEILYAYSLVNNDVFLLFILFSGIIVAIANVFVFYIIEKQGDYIRTKQKLKFAEENIEQQKIHYKELYEQQEALKKFRHDSKNMYEALLTKIETMSPGDAADYVREHLSMVNNTTEEINSGNPVIDSVIGSKISTARKIDAQIITSVRLTKPLLVNELYLGVLLGNALDNAIEAVEKLPDAADRIIKLSMITVEEMLSINVENNSYPPPNAKFWEKGGTLKDDTRNHGYGIQSMQTIAAKYDGIVTTGYENGVFTLSAIMANVKRD